MLHSEQPEQPEQPDHPVWLRLVLPDFDADLLRPPTPDELFLVELFNACDRQAFAKVGNDDDSKELAADVLKKLLFELAKDPSLIEHKDELRRRCYQRTRSKIFNWFRTKGPKGALARFYKIEREIGPQSLDEMEAVVNGEDSNPDLARACAKLSPDELKAVYLHHGEGMTIPELAKALRISEYAVRQRIYRGMQKLRAELGVKRPEKGQ